LPDAASTLKPIDEHQMKTETGGVQLRGTQIDTGVAIGSIPSDPQKEKRAKDAQEGLMTSLVPADHEQMNRLKKDGVVAQNAASAFTQRTPISESA